MGNKIAFMGVGAVGGYAGAHMAQAGEDVTFIDPWPAHVEKMQSDGLKISHIRDVPEFTVKVRAMHLTDAQQLAKEKPIDIAFVCMKSYDTEWATTLISQYLAPGGFIVSLQNCMNEETIAGVVGWGKTVGCIASSITVDLCEPGHVRRAAGKSGAKHTVFRTGEVHGRVTDRVKEICRLVRLGRQRDGHREPVGRALVEAGDQRDGQRAVRLHRHDRQGHGPERRDPPASPPASAARRSASARRSAMSWRRSSTSIRRSSPRAGEGDAAATRTYDEHRLAEVSKAGGGEHRPSMGQDMVKGRRTEIEFLNGLVAKKGDEIGIATPANVVLTDIVKRVERGDLKPDPKHITDLRLN